MIPLALTIIWAALVAVACFICVHPRSSAVKK